VVIAELMRRLGRRNGVLSGVDMVSRLVASRLLGAARGLSDAVERALTSGAVTSTQLRICQFMLSVAFAGLGVWGLAKAEYGIGAFNFALGTFWLLMAAYGNRLVAARTRQRQRPGP
jgi:hypothetical protein